LRELWWLLKELPDGTFDIPKHAGDLLTPSEHILCMESWLYRLIVFTVHETYNIKMEAACCSLGWVSTNNTHSDNPTLQGQLNCSP